MIKLCWFEFWNKIAASINGWKRQVFEKWDRVVVTDKDKMYLMRLWAKLICERVVLFDEVFWSDYPEEAVKETKTPEKKTPKAVKETKTPESE